MIEKTLEDFADLLGRLLARRHLQQASPPEKYRDQPPDDRRDREKPLNVADHGPFESLLPPDPGKD